MEYTWYKLVLHLVLINPATQPTSLRRSQILTCVAYNFYESSNPTKLSERELKIGLGKIQHNIYARKAILFKSFFGQN